MRKLSVCRGGFSCRCQRSKAPPPLQHARQIAGGGRRKRRRRDNGLRRLFQLALHHSDLLQQALLPLRRVFPLTPFVLQQPTAAQQRQRADAHPCDSSNSQPGKLSQRRSPDDKRLSITPPLRRQMKGVQAIFALCHLSQMQPWQRRYPRQPPFELRDGRRRAAQSTQP